MPKVHPDQRTKFESDELFKKLCQECDVKYTGFKDKGHEERKQKFLQDITEGHTVMTFVSTGTNLTLVFCQRALCDDRPADLRPTKETVDFEREQGKVYLMSPFIMNGVCVKWKGWIDLEALSGKAKLIFDAEQAKIEDDTLKRVMKETQERVRIFEENQRKWKEQQQQQQQQQAESPQMVRSH